MKRVDLTSISVFDILMDFTVVGEYIDLHNNFLCTKIETDPFHSRILFHFESDDRYFRLIFSEGKIFHFQLDILQSTIEKGLCFGSLSRRNAIMGSNDSFLDLPENRSYYEVAEISFVVEAEKVILQESSRGDLDLVRTLEKEILSLTCQIAELKTKLADLENHSGTDAKTFFASRKERKVKLANLEGELKQKRVHIDKMQEQDRLLLT